MTLLAFLTAYKLRLITKPIEGIAKQIDYTNLPSSQEYLHFSTSTAIALIIVFAIGNLYKLHSSFKFTKELKRVTILFTIWAMLVINYFFFTRTFPFSRLAIMYSWLFTYIFIIIGRGIIRIIQLHLLKYNIGKRQLLFIGDNEITQEIYKTIKKDPIYKIIGSLNNDDKKTKIKKLGKINDLDQIIQKYDIDEIIQTTFNATEKQTEDIIGLCDLNHINYRFVPDLLEVRRTNVSIGRINTIPILNLKSTPLDGWGKVAKRIMDIIISILAIIILSPVYIITAIAIRIDSEGPILFSKKDDGTDVKRIGQYGKPFTFYKFRSMKPKTDSLRYTKLATKNTRKTGPLVKIKNDPRVTKIGKFIRKYSIDELPQIWNVIIGNMSLVGPRPHLPEEVSKYKNHHRFVLTIKPGITGISQINGRSDLSFDDEIKLDRFYIENWSIWLDIKLLFKTFFIVIKGHEE